MQTNSHPQNEWNEQTFGAFAALTLSTQQTVLAGIGSRVNPVNCSESAPSRTRDYHKSGSAHTGRHLYGKSPAHCSIFLYRSVCGLQRHHWTYEAALAHERREGSSGMDQMLGFAHSLFTSFCVTVQRRKSRVKLKRDRPAVLSISVDAVRMNRLQQQDRAEMRPVVAHAQVHFISH